MMRGLIDTLERHHGVRILNEAVVDAVRLSNRYISGRQLPDKSVSLLDTACARVAMSHAATPPPVEDRRRRDRTIGRCRSTCSSAKPSPAASHDEQARRNEGRAGRSARRIEGARKAQWEKEKELVAKIRDLAIGSKAARPLPSRRSQAKRRSRRKPAPRRRASQGRRDSRSQPRRQPRRGKSRQPTLTPAERAKASRRAGQAQRRTNASCKAKRRWCKSASIRRPWPTSSPLGPASRSAGWCRTKFKPC